MMRALAILAIVLAACPLVRGADAAGGDAQTVIRLSGEIRGATSDEVAAARADELADVARRVFLASRALDELGRADAAKLGLVEHVVAAGDNPTTIAKRYKIGVGLLSRLNKALDAGSLKIGQKLEVLDLAATPLRIVVVASRYRLTAWRGEICLAAMHCGLGKDASPTPRGDTRVVLRMRDPSWTNPDTHEQLAGNDPRNILGGFWMGFEPGADGRFKGIGMHGFTGDDVQNWLDKPGSHGCVRLRQDDIGALFDLAVEGTAVSIRD